MDGIVRLLNQQMALLDISEDLRRSEEDGEHVKKDGCIHYILDENIFEYLLSPTFQSQAHSGFYASPWRSDDEISDAHVPESFEAQTALLTSEWILSGTLPGASSNNLALSDVHRNELASRVGDVNNDLRVKTAAEAHNFKEKLAQKVRINDALAGKSDIALDLEDEELTALIEKDLKTLRGARVDPSVLDLFKTARQAAAIVSEEGFFEQVMQLSRINSSEIFGRTISVESNFALSNGDLNEIHNDAIVWLGHILKELKKPGNSRRRRFKRTEKGNVQNKLAGSLWNDAWAIALVQKLAEMNKDEEARFVFVTGDQLLVDAYRRWYYPAQGPRDCPFVIRRFAQYAPHFNPRDAGGAFNALSQNGAYAFNLFDSIQSAIETSIIPWLARNSAEPSLGLENYYQRETISLLRSDNPKFADEKAIRDLIDLSRASEASLPDEWASIAGRWREIQRIAIGAFPNLIGFRTGSHGEVLARLMNLTDAVTLNEYVDDLLYDLSHDSLKLWLPGAKALVKRLREMQVSRRHAPAVSFEHMLDSVGEVDAPEITFLSAACLSMEAGDIPTALRYADLASRSDQKLVETDANLANLHREVTFLESVANRYSIATQARHFGPMPSNLKAAAKVSRAIESVKDAFNTARRGLAADLEYHQRRFDEARSAVEGAPHALRILRATSERAALQLFYGTSLGLARGGRAAELSQYDLVREAKAAIYQSIDDLNRCLLLFADMAGGADLIESDVEILDRVEMQFTINMVSVSVMKYLIDDYFVFPFQMAAKAALSRARQLSKQFQINHPVAIAEFTAFEYLSGDMKGRQMPVTLSGSATKQTNIPLDDLLYKSIHERILNKKRVQRGARTS